MTSDLDIYRTANELIREHGQDAPIHATMRADELLTNFDDEDELWGPSANVRFGSTTEVSDGHVNVRSWG